MQSNLGSFLLHPDPQACSTNPIPSIYDLPLPPATSNLFHSDTKNSLLTLNLSDSTRYNSSSDFESGSPIEPTSLHHKYRNSPSHDRTKGIWSFKEDEALRQAISEVQGTISWEDVSKKVPGRNPKQCRERWLYRLCPGVNKTPFQKWEDELIVVERQKIGNHWTAIAAKLPGRTSYAVKNRWYTVLRNRVKTGQIKQSNQQPKVEAIQAIPQPHQLCQNYFTYVPATYIYPQPVSYVITYN